MGHLLGRQTQALSSVGSIHSLEVQPSHCILPPQVVHAVIGQRAFLVDALLVPGPAQPLTEPVDG